MFFPATLLVSAALVARPQPRSPGAIKEAISQLAATTTGGASATVAGAAEAATLVAELEGSRGGIERPALSPSMDGRWEQVYTDNSRSGTVWADGTSSRRQLVGPLAGRVEHVVVLGDGDGFPKYAQRVRGPAIALGLGAEMRASVAPQDDGVTWEVTFDEVRWSLFRGILPLFRRALPPGGGGLWRTSYLDRDTRVLRAQSKRGGAPTLYVLRRKGRP